MNTYRIVYMHHHPDYWPIVIRVKDHTKDGAKHTAMHLKDSLMQLGVIPQSKVKVDVQLEFRKSQKVRFFQS